MSVNLGDKVRDRITGFEGIVIGITEWLWQCRRPIVQPATLQSDGKPIDSQSFDEPQLEVIEPGVFVPPLEIAARPKRRETGGPRETPSRRVDPRR